jgi:hypothetical protein
MPPDWIKSSLVQAVAHAEQALSHVQPFYNTGDTAFQVHVPGLGCMRMVAREEIARVERFALALIEKQAAAHPFLH